MSSNLVPKVILTEVAEGLAVPQNNQVIIGIIGTAASGTVNTVYKVRSVSEGESYFGSNTAFGANLMKMIRRAFAEGASAVRAITVGAPTLAAATSGANATKAALTADAAVGATSVSVTDGTAFTTGDVIYIGTGSAYDKEERRVVATIAANVLNFTAPLVFAHFIGEKAQVVTEKVAADYTSAITELGMEETKSVVICELNDDTTAAAMATMADSSTANYNTPCIYIRSALSSDTESTVAAKALAANNKRVIITYPLLVDFNGATVTPGETAAAFAGVLAGNGVPKLNHNFSSFENFAGVSARINDMDALISSGVTPIELKYEEIHIVRFVTTYTKKNGVPDSTWKEGAVRLNVDSIQKTISRVVQQKFLQAGNTPQVRLAIEKEVTALLNVFASSQILVQDERTGTPAFQKPVVSTDANDATKVNVDISISPGKPLNFISLNFKVFL